MRILNSYINIFKTVTIYGILVDIMTAFDVVYPQGNEREFVEMAKLLGYSEIVFLTDNIRYTAPSGASLNISAHSNASSCPLKIKTAFLVRDVSDIRKVRTKFDYVFAEAKRKYFESNVDFIIDSELSDRKDSFHYRSTFLNQVHAVLAKDNNISIVFSFHNLSDSPVLMFGRMCQNFELVKKYALGHSSFSMARHPSEMKSRTILDALLNVLS